MNDQKKDGTIPIEIVVSRGVMPGQAYLLGEGVFTRTIVRGPNGEEVAVDRVKPNHVVLIKGLGNGGRVELSHKAIERSVAAMLQVGGERPNEITITPADFETYFPGRIADPNFLQFINVLGCQLKVILSIWVGPGWCVIGHRPPPSKIECPECDGDGVCRYCAGEGEVER